MSKLREREREYSSIYTSTMQRTFRYKLSFYRLFHMQLFQTVVFSINISFLLLASKISFWWETEKLFEGMDRGERICFIFLKRVAWDSIYLYYNYFYGEKETELRVKNFSSIYLSPFT